MHRVLVPAVLRYVPGSQAEQIAVAPASCLFHPAIQTSSEQREFVASHVDPTPQSADSTAHTVAASSPAPGQQQRRTKEKLLYAPHVELDAVLG